MNPLFNIIFVLTFVSVIPCLGQDTTIYCQTNSPWVSNCFHFYKTDKNVNGGIVEKRMESDDGQHWHGVGTYVETNNKIVVHSMNLVKTQNDFQGNKMVKDSLTKETLLIPALTFHKRKVALVLKDGKRKSTTFSLYKP